MGKWKKWLSAGLFTALLGTAIIAGPTADVSANAGNKPYNIENVSPECASGTKCRRFLFQDKLKGMAQIDGVCYNGSGRSRRSHYQRHGCLRMAGKDQLEGSQEDLDFAFVRISYGTRHLDDYYDYNMTEAEAADVPVGTYVYSLAKTNKEALAEAQLAIRQMQGHKVSYPVAFDLEDEATLGTLTRKEISQIALTFCDEIRKAGYTPILYMNLIGIIIL